MGTMSFSVRGFVGPPSVVVGKRAGAYLSCMLKAYLDTSMVVFRELGRHGFA